VSKTEWDGRCGGCDGCGGCGWWVQWVQWLGEMRMLLAAQKLSLLLTKILLPSFHHSLSTNSITNQTKQANSIACITKKEEFFFCL
jgi:hypothetical protein